MDDAKSRLVSGAFFGFFQTLLMAFAMLIPAMYFSSLNISIAVYAFLLLIGDVFSFLIKPVIGFLTDKYGERKYLLTGVFVFFFSLFLIGYTTSIQWIIVLKIISGIASALVFVMILIYSLRKVGEKPEKKIGLYGGISNMGWVVGLLIPGIFIDYFGVSLAFYLILAAGIIWFVLIFSFAKKYESGVSVKPSLSFVKKIPALIIFKTMDLAMFSAFLFFFTRYALKTLGLSRSVVSFIVVAEVIFFAASIFVIGRVSNKRIRRYYVLLCVIFHILAATTMVFAGPIAKYFNVNSLIPYYLVGVFIGVAGGFIEIWVFSTISETFAENEKGRVIGTFGWSYDLATILGALIPVIFVGLGLETFTALYFFPVIMLVTYFISFSSRLTKKSKVNFSNIYK